MGALADFAAGLGLPVFPCAADKKPIVEGGFHRASSDPVTIRNMFASPSAKMIGMPTGEASHLIAIDIDIKSGAQGDAWLQANAHRLPTTRTHKTQSGGLHLLFRQPEGVELRNSASRVAPGVDVRASGGYVILPGSPGYTVADPADAAEMPAWLVLACAKPEPAQPAQVATHRQHERLERYTQAAIDGEVLSVMRAGEGTRNDTLNTAAVKLGSLVAARQVSRSTVEAELTNAALAAGLDRREVAATVKSGLDFGMSRPREMPEREQPTKADKPRQATATTDSTRQTDERKSKFRTLSIADVLELPPPEWLVEGVLTCGGYAGIYGPPASFKSFVILGMGLAISYGQEWCGRAAKQMGVLYVAGEGARGLGKRIKAWQQHFSLQGVDTPFRLLCDGVNLTSPEDTAELILATVEAAEVEKQPIGLVIIDTVARAMVGADENSATDMGKFNEACAQIIRGVENAPNVCAVHHTGKDTERGARGSNSFHGALDTMLKVTREGERLTLKVEKQKDDEDGFEIRLKTVGISAAEGAKPYSLVVVDGSDEPAPAASVRAKRLSPGRQLALDALLSAVEQHGKRRQGMQDIPDNVLTVTESEWRAAYYLRSMSPTTEAKAAAFKNAYEDLSARTIVRKVAGFAWVVRS